jgi:hypothetical protein
MLGEVVARGQGRAQASSVSLDTHHPARLALQSPPSGMLLSPLRAALHPSPSTAAAALRSSTPAIVSFRFMASASPSADQSATRQTTSIPPPSMEDAIRTKVCVAGLNLAPAASYADLRPCTPSVQLVDLLQPTLLEVRNDSSKHAHHRPMKEPGAYTVSLGLQPVPCRRC